MASLASNVEQRIRSVQHAVDGAKASWSTGDVQFGGADPNQVLGALRNIEGVAFAKFARAGRAFVDSPDTATQAAMDKWVAWGNELFKDLHDIAGYSAEASLSTVLVDTAKVTSSTVVAQVGGGLVWWGKHGKAVLIGVAALVAALVAWRLFRAGRAVVGA